ncbi:MAG: hypothetical protein Q4B99_05250 [Clostridia bacterium]|nr:hypothetical protein [Clostridia bacterium]
MKQYYKRGIADRYDGWRAKNVDGVYALIPFIMRTRLDSQNFFEDALPLERMEAFIRKHKEEMPELTLMHVFMAAMVRLISQRPYLNRFVVYNKIYARNSITISLAIKRKESGTETVVKPEFEPEDTLRDVVDKVSSVLDDNLSETKKNSADNISALFLKFPAFVTRFLVWVFYKLDSVGWLPKSIHSASPWHTSVFLTNMGSLGINPIYHHLYEFGTCSLFLAIGNKQRIQSVSPEGNPHVRRSIGIKFVTDERICDGQYYATSMKMLRKMLLNPEVLLTPPDEVRIDDGVRNKRLAT